PGDFGILRAGVMSTAEVPRKSSRWLFWTTVVAALMVVALFSSIFVTILNDSTKQELHPADAIVVFGAAQYDGRPSPVYKARLDHAAQLYHRGLAPMVIITGGSGGDPRFTEGVVGREYLKTLGLPDSQLIAETQSSDTAESA